MSSKWFVSVQFGITQSVFLNQKSFFFSHIDSKYHLKDEKQGERARYVKLQTKRDWKSVVISLMDWSEI